MGEWVVHSHQTAFLLAPFKHWELSNPQQGELVLVAQTQLVTHLQTQFTELLASLHRIVTAEDEDEVTWFGIHLHLQGIELFRGVELIDTRLHAAVFLHTSIYQPFGSNLRTFHEVSQLVELFTSIDSTTRCADTSDISSSVEYWESTQLQHIHQFYKLHTETHIWLVATESAHCFCPRHTQEWLVQFYATKHLEQVFGHSFECLDDIFLCHERHLAVYLSELRLTVSTQVLIAETFCNLEITVETTDHQQLLQGLRTLRQGVELTFVHA